MRSRSICTATRTFASISSSSLAPQDLITEMIKANPSFKPPADYKPEKKYRRLRIPLEEYPGYNFIGLIIGPRGNTQKRMERVRVVVGLVWFGLLGSPQRQSCLLFWGLGLLLPPAGTLLLLLHTLLPTRACC